MLCAVLLLGACGPASNGRPSTASQSPRWRPPEISRIEGWPPLPLSLEETSPAFQRLWSLAQPPETLHGPRRQSIDEWVEQTYVPWLDARVQAISEATEARRQIQAEGEGERALGAALFALVHAHTAERLMALRLGLSDEERRELQRPVPRLERRALRAFESCMELAMAPHLDAWRARCSEEFASPRYEAGRSTGEDL